jgi:hypothetical protein
MTRQELLARLDRAAQDLEVVQLPMVFVGGATLPLYVDDEAHDLRETKDVDVMVEATSYAEFAELEERLRTAGFQHDTSRNAPRCRWLKGGQQYDIVDVRTDYPSDRWVRATGPGIEQRMLPSGRTIPVLSPGRFLAAKVTALTQRGGGDSWYASSDFEDIVLLLESHPQLQPWLAGTPREAVLAVAAWAAAALKRPGIGEEIEGTLSRGPGIAQRVEAVFDRLLWLAVAWPNL